MTQEDDCPRAHHSAMRQRAIMMHAIFTVLSQQAGNDNKQTKINGSCMIILKANQCNGSNTDFPIS